MPKDTTTLDIFRKQLRYTEALSAHLRLLIKTIENDPNIQRFDELMTEFARLRRDGYDEPESKGALTEEELIKVLGGQDY